MQRVDSMTPEFIQPDWPAPANVHALSTTRGGGISRPPYDSLNLGAHVGDDGDAVATNRERLRALAALPAEPVWLQQVHGVNVVDLSRQAVDHEQADAAFTRESGPVCAIMTADCLPVLLAAADGRVVGAAHAGWRGLAAGVLPATVEAMGVAQADLMVWLGPAIGPAAFEVGDEVRSAFLAADAGNANCFVRKGDAWLADLFALARRQLASLGVTAVYGGGECTYTDVARFFSYRRDGICGRMASLIWMQ